MDKPKDSNRDREPSKSEVDAFIKRLEDNPPNLERNADPVVDDLPKRGQLTGRILGVYHLEEEIGRGGMGVVYAATQKPLNRKVAVKVILPGVLAGPKDIERFRTEAVAAAKLRHEHFVGVFDAGEQDGLHYYAMNFVHGPPLKKQLASGPLPPRDAAELVRLLADAVQYAHDNKVIHRDLKPANVLLAARTGNRAPRFQDERLAGYEPLIADFGLAKHADQTERLTVTGQIMGTPEYMAPEQATGSAEAVKPAVDVYALGAILYELLTGRPPFKADTAFNTLQLVQKSVPEAPSRLSRAVDHDLNTICLKCLEKQPEQRYKSARALAGDLQRYLNREPIKARPAGFGERFGKWCRREPWRAAATIIPSVLVVLLVGALVMVNVAFSREKQARQYAEQMFGWTKDSLTNYQSAIFNDAKFVDDTGYRKLHAELIRITTEHYEKIAKLKIANPEDFAFLEANRGEAYWWLGTVKTDEGWRAATARDKKKGYEEALECFRQMESIYANLASLHPNDSDYQLRRALSRIWSSEVLHRLDRSAEAKNECRQVIASLRKIHHPQTPMALAAALLELAIIAAAEKDLPAAESAVRSAVANLQEAKLSENAFLKRNQVILIQRRLESVADKLIRAAAWNAALDILVLLRHRSPNDPMPAYCVAICRLAAGDKTGYLRDRREILNRWKNGDDSQLERIMFAYGPMPLDAVDNAEATALSAVARKLEQTGDAWKMRAAGAGLYRLGRYKDALRCLTGNPSRRGWDCFLLAMCLHRVGQRDAALEHLKKGRSWFEMAENGKEHAGWTERIETRILMDEAARLIANREPP